MREGATLTATQAVAENVADYVARDLEDLLRQADGRKVRLLENETTLNTANMKIVSIRKKLIRTDGNGVKLAWSLVRQAR